MSRHPVTVPSGSMVSDAVAIMAERKLSELPVIDDSGTPLGLLDITDLVNRNFVDKESAQTQDNAGLANTTNPGCVPYPKLCAESKVERARDTADIPDFTKRKKRRSG
jgi:arabinose-5-phosphate isomerase